MIQCDEVFDILTRGPFPTGAPSDGVVELHLTRCESCRQLAEALRPAVELFQEAIAPEEGRDLPSYWGESRSDLAPWLTAEERASARVVQRAQSTRRRIRPTLALPRWSLRPAARIAAAALIGMALAGMLRRLGSDGPAAGGPKSLAGAGPARWQLRDDPQSWSTKMGLKPRCTATMPGAMLVASLDVSGPAQTPFRQACCTACHSAAAERPQGSSATAAQLVQACSACHGN